MAGSDDKVFEAVAADLREFGYPDVTAAMISEIHEARERGDEKLPHGIIGRFAADALDTAKERELLP